MSYSNARLYQCLNREGQQDEKTNQSIPSNSIGPERILKTATKPSSRLPAQEAFIMIWNPDSKDMSATLKLCHSSAQHYKPVRLHQHARVLWTE